MFNFKIGMVMMDVVKVVNDLKVGKVIYWIDCDGNVYVFVGKVLFDIDKLVGNFKIIEDIIVKVCLVLVCGIFI